MLQIEQVLVLTSSLLDLASNNAIRYVWTKNAVTPPSISMSFDIILPGMGLKMQSDSKPNVLAATMGDR